MSQHEADCGICPCCGDRMELCDDETPGEDPRGPRPGDVALCGACGAILTLRASDAPGGLRAWRAAADDFERWAGQGLLPGIQAALDRIRGRPA